MKLSVGNSPLKYAEQDRNYLNKKNTDLHETVSFLSLRWTVQIRYRQVLRTNADECVQNLDADPADTIWAVTDLADAIRTHYGYNGSIQMAIRSICKFRICVCDWGFTNFNSIPRPLYRF